MKKTVVILVISCIAFLFAQEREKTDSKVISATVFKNRALVTREAEINLSKGMHSIIFSNLPDDLIDESVRIATGGSNAVKVLDVKVEKRFTTATRQEKIKVMENQIDSLQQLIKETTDRISVYYDKKAFVEALKTQSSTYINEKMLINMKNTKEWGDVLLYVDNNLNKIFEGIREQKHCQSKLDEQIKSIRSEIDNSQGAQTKNFKEVILKVEIGKKGNLKLYPSYLVQNASWFPLYDARVLSKSKEIELHYFGMLQQSTGEDWDDISLTLSTAEPLSVKSLPDLDRWFINTSPLPVRYPVNINNYGNSENVTYERNMGFSPGIGAITGYIIDQETGEPLIGANVVLDNTKIATATNTEGKYYLSNVPAGHYNLNVTYAGYTPKSISFNVSERNIANLTLSLNHLSNDILPVEVTGKKFFEEKSTNTTRVFDASEINMPPVKVDQKYTNVYAGELSTTFEVPTKNSIPSDNSPHKVTIAIGNSPIEFKYTSIPKLSPAVYLNGKVVNIKNYPLLQGEMNVFIDNDFINRTSINTIVPSDTLELALGIDESIQAKKVLINKFQESKGLLGGKKQITYEYEIQIKNNRKTEESIVVYDQVPITMNEEIIIELLEPKKEIKDLDNEQKLEWTVKLKPGDKINIPVKYKVLFPENSNIYGLE
jgi:hypothetical protein